MKIFEGTIISCDRDDSVLRYLVEDKGRIVFVGDILPAEYGAAPRVPLGAGSLLPAFGDTHLHFMSHALFHAGLDVRSAHSLPFAVSSSTAMKRSWNLRRGPIARGCRSRCTRSVMQPSIRRSGRWKPP